MIFYVQRVSPFFHQSSSHSCFFRAQGSFQIPFLARCQSRSKISDEKLVKAAIEGDVEAIEILKTRIKSVALPTIKKKGIPDSDEDVKVMGNEIVITALPKFIFRISFEKWVYRITVNMIIEHQRKVMARRRQSQSLNGSKS